MIVAIHKKDRIRKKRRQARVRSHVKEVSTLPRVCVFRSLKHMYAQIIDDNAHATLASCSTLELKDVKGDKKIAAHTVGKELAKRAQEKGVQSVVFDRGCFRFHGRVKAVADGLREGGLKV